MPGLPTCQLRKYQRRRPESNWCKRLCRPLRNHSATAPEPFQGTRRGAKGGVVRLVARMHHRDRTVEQELARLAGERHGDVTRKQLLRLGVTADEIKGRLRSGALIREYSGVFRVGHQAPNADSSYVAAVLAAARGRCSADVRPAIFTASSGARPRRPRPLPRPSGGCRASSRAAAGAWTHATPRSCAASRSRRWLEPWSISPRSWQSTISHVLVTRGGRAERNVSCAGRGGAQPAACQPGSGEAPHGAERRRPRHPQHARAKVPRAAASGSAPVARDESRGRRPPRRLPLA